MHEQSRIHVTMVHLPALDTPQFDWVLHRLPGKPQPLPPIFAPELAATAIHWAATHRRREVFVTGAVAAAIHANKSVLDFWIAIWHAAPTTASTCRCSQVSSSHRTCVHRFLATTARTAGFVPKRIVTARSSG
jgi:hypothetical protein